MKYIGMPAGMWLLFRNSFRNNLTAVLGFSKSEAAEITEKALLEYKRIIGMPIILLYSNKAFSVISAASLLLKPNTAVRLFLKEFLNSSHIPAGIPIYFINLHLGIQF